MEIFKDDHDISRSIFLELANGSLSLQSYDSGGGFNEERIITINDLSAIKKVFNVKTNEDLLEKIKASYSKSDAIDSFVDFLNKSNIKFIFHCFTG